jgi:hypothetical protein
MAAEQPESRQDRAESREELGPEPSALMYGTWRIQEQTSKRKKITKECIPVPKQAESHENRPNLSKTEH